MNRVVLVIAWGLIAMLFAACGSDDGAPNNQGAAASAVAQFFVQERDGGRLPEGTAVRGVGIETNGVVTLEVRDADKERSVAERYCMVYRYQVPAANFRQHNRVYVAELIDGAWSIEAVNPDGTCEGVV